MSDRPLSGVPDDAVEAWLSAPRLATYVDAAGDRDRGLALYEWNSSMATALMRDLGYLEVGLRNAYDRVLLTADSPDWAEDPESTIFTSARAPDRSANLDKLEAEESELRDLLQSARDHVGGAGRGKIVAELMFGFWSKLTSRRLTASLWTPYLHAAFPAGTTRPQVHGTVIALNNLRNRVAHHEPLFTPNVHLAHRLDQLENLLQALNPSMAEWIIHTSHCRPHLALAPVRIS
ncbi:MAG: hypothetical protein EPO13_08800 [Actinomycetota bacterium]|nr:MAG: hypothetical protein EPO13_08800 [Actinomycetota bacterium]